MKMSTDGNITKFDVFDITGVLIVSGIALSGCCGFAGLVVGTDGTNDIILNVFDSLTAAGKQLVPNDLIISGSSKVWTLNYDYPVKVNTGIYVEITCSGNASVQVVYDH